MAMYQLSLGIAKEHLGENHLYVSNTLNGMANVLQDLGCLDDAIDAYRESLEIRAKNLGKDHLSVAQTYNNLANALYLQGGQGLERAMELYEGLLDIKKRNRGEYHVSVANTYNNMAVVYQGKGTTKEAIDMYHLSLNICKVALGEDHSSFSNAFENALGLLKGQDDESKALETFYILLEIQATILGGNHPLIAETCRYMGELLQSKQQRCDGYFKAAMEMYEHSLEIYVETLGKEHWQVSIACSKIANMLDDHNFLLHCRNALEFSHKALGEDHWHFLDCYSKFQNMVEREVMHLQKLALPEKAIEIIDEACSLESRVSDHARSPRISKLMTELDLYLYTIRWKQNA
ncbi:unnamed protein product [Cylindrotheca closterium]|uniref:Kinesin light chain n=1 Tax=Cylindrotheca closterium TaxID=2856 RepID=A0AAD2CGJ4_9STRA|nr:unnamed protein product [Cylindrotheca closterium]